ncbi:MAG: c-type cytochrome [Anaerolineae bacterium]
MKKANFVKIVQMGGLVVVAIVTILVTGLMTRERPVHALPEYAARTGEACATCHVNPGGGGPRTLRGLLWAANGRPDAVPVLDLLIAPGVEDGAELYDIACAGCHGFAGEGLFGIALTGSGLRESKIRSTTERGRERSGMPAFEGQFTDDQMDALVTFVGGIASGQIEPQPNSYELPPAEFTCNPAPGAEKCGGN